MGMIRFSHAPLFSGWFAPMHALAGWLTPAKVAPCKFPSPTKTRQTAYQPTWPFLAHGGGIRSSPFAPAASTGKCASGTPVSKLKVVREFDPSIRPTAAGRMVISGRMADVCAELERMTNCENAAR